MHSQTVLSSLYKETVCGWFCFGETGKTSPTGGLFYARCNAYSAGMVFVVTAHVVALCLQKFPPICQNVGAIAKTRSFVWIC